MALHEKIFDAGVVGAGGAGFPTHVKAKSKVEFVLANGAECEPLIHKDVELMQNFPEQIIKGMNLMMDAASAKKGYFGIKSKNITAIDQIKSKIGGAQIEMHLMGDFYPAGDEYELVFSATKKLIPPYGLPLDVGCVVNNVETFYNVSNAEAGKPVTEKFVSVAGLVNNPSSFFAPIGTSFEDLIKNVGGTAINDYAIFVSGILMGTLTFDISDVVKKTTAGIIILPKDHYLVNRNKRPVEDMNRIGKSACDQCSYCTELCPRYLLGYDVQPHKVMRSLSFSKSGTDYWNDYAALCCSCGLCSLYSCPEDLYPREACDQSKFEMKRQNIKFNQTKPVQVHPIKDGRRVPLKQLRKKLDIERFEQSTPFILQQPDPDSVKIYLSQHVGVPAKTIVSRGQQVKKGDVIGKIEEGKLGAPVHASISGSVSFITDDFIQITR
ncbi:4Fe-4S dicluster domain-containing protein [Bacteroidota bacterium]